jgi:hypothetical protein
MAKHPHKLMLIDNRTWRCMLEGCAFFVHLGLAHVIVGKRIVCWTCGDTFLVEKELSTLEFKPTCGLCHGGFEVPSAMELDAYIRDRIEQNKKKKQEEKDEIEVIEPDEVHAPDCGVYDGLDCNCK